MHSKENVSILSLKYELDASARSDQNWKNFKIP